MTQSPQSGQAAPRTTDYGAVNAPHNPPGSAAPGGSPGHAPSAHAPSAHAPSAHAPSDWSTPGYSGANSESPGAPNGAPHGTAPTIDRPPAQSERRTRTSRSRGPRRARLQLRHIDPWTVLKFSCVLSIALFFVWLIVVGVLFGILDGAGIIGKINDTVTTLQGGNAQPPVTAGIVFGGAAIIGVVNIVLFIALSTVGSLVYNLCSDLVGGVEVTLSER